MVKTESGAARTHYESKLVWLRIMSMKNTIPLSFRLVRMFTSCRFFSSRDPLNKQSDN